MAYKPRADISEEQKNYVFDTVSYCLDTGVFTYISAAGNKKPGDLCGCYHKNGYLLTRLGGRNYLLHRLAFLFVNGRLPLGFVDHINGIKDDNSWSNLREIEHSVNMENFRSPRSDNTSGYLGVSSHKNAKFQAKISINGVTKYLGSFSCPIEASETYLKAKRKLHRGCTI